MELSDYHCCPYDSYFQFAHTVELSAMTKYVLYPSYMRRHFILLLLKFDFNHYGVYLRVLNSIYLLSLYQTCF
jgi:hypothetical protein